nr:phage portal protein [Listeria fleischmannii]
MKNSNQYDKAVREFALKEMQNTRDSFILKYGQNVDPEKKAAIVEDFKRFYEENGGVLFQEPGVEVEKITRDFIAGDMKIAEEITRDRIANVYNIPSIFLNSNSDSFSSNEQLMQMFVNLTLIPIIRQYEKEFNRKLLSVKQRNEKYYFKFSVNGLLRGDSEARANFYSKGLRDGWLKRDDVRAWEELPPEGGMAAELWISGDMYPLEMDPSLRKGNIGKSESGES